MKVSFLSTTIREPYVRTQLNAAFRTAVDQAFQHSTITETEIMLTKIGHKTQTFNPLIMIGVGFILLRDIYGDLCLKFNLPPEI
jgi:hypothetical protein